METLIAFIFGLSSIWFFLAGIDKLSYMMLVPKKQRQREKLNWEIIKIENRLKKIQRIKEKGKVKNPWALSEKEQKLICNLEILKTYREYQQYY